MPYQIVKGEFHLFYKKQKLVGSQPDGDSVWFKPDNRALLNKLGNNRRDAIFNAGGSTLLKFEGVDTLELSFRGSHQFTEGAKKARNFTLKSTYWTGGAANCTATLYLNDGRRYRDLASTSFPVAA